MRNYAGSALMLFVTMAAAVGSYTVNLKVSAERSAVARLQRQIVADGNDMRDLQAELRTRARLPEMQRWNDNVLMMAAPAAGQYLRSPVQLASFGVTPEAAPAEAGVRYAVTIAVPTANAAPVVQAAYERPARPGGQLAPAAPEVARIIRASYPAASRPAAQRPAGITAPGMAADLSGDLAADIGASLDAAPAPRDLLPEGGQ